ncbi:hypothetical protein SPRG_05453 [Saprolegnia parasitica CBS 223.65]|uniref:Secreted protein n=1 Tax=Saprolegnia parasitica (strain CBS 223.65) TaxID=695850 RepID=A0A067CFL8_SAPPC|nr:hypothetical protein SPRG_05453 [Saprolegnia parasitica CBS 223.65]KDO29273.1 hypothetical protein SPRG_05453 [Saprolegnia parasitica CBS 223.65]|eukprot:XP_012200087.1 hypothetical protein SPRG_05453 [Saprolegnia parasitica CBS 223.65]
MRRTAIACLFGLAALMDAAALPPILPQALGGAIDAFKPVVAAYAASALPASIGNCSAGAPKPCENIGDLYATTTSLYSVRARWLGGLNTLSLDALSVTSDVNGSITAAATVTFASLPMSLQVDACLPGVGCNPLLDNTDTCCGGPKTIQVTAVATCNETFPFLRNLTLTRVQIAPALEIKYNVSGKPVTLLDATSLVQTQIATQGSAFLQAQAMGPINDKINGATTAPKTVKPSSSPAVGAVWSPLALVASVAAVVLVQT